MGLTTHTVKVQHAKNSSRKGKTIAKAAPQQIGLVATPYFVMIANILKALRPKMDGRLETSFSPDAWCLQSLWPKFLNELSFEEKLALSNDLKHEGCKVLTKLLSIDYLALYDKVTRNAVKLFERKIMKNKRNTTLIEGFKYLIAFFVFLQNGPKLPMENNLLEVDTSFDGENSYFSIYAIIEALNKILLDEIDDKSIDLDLLVFWIENLELNDSASIKLFCQLPLTQDELESSLISLRTPNDIRRFKERVFYKGAWYTCSSLVFTSLNKTHINYSALLNKLLEVKQNRGFDGLKNVQSKEVELQTFFSGVRVMTEYQITVQRWVFTDPYEADILALYLSENIEELDAQ